MLENNKGTEELEVDRQIRLAELNLNRLSGRTLEEVVVTAMGKFNDDPEKVADDLVAQKVFEQTADCSDPRKIALAATQRIMQRHPLP